MAGDTKAMIAEALLEAATHKPIDKVTVKDVVETCGITRQTFYYHFQDLLDVVEWLMAQRVDALLEKTLAADTPQGAIRVLVSTLEEQPDVISQLMNSRKREDAERIFFNAARTFFSELMRHSAVEPRIRYASDMDVALTFYSSAVVGVLIDSSRKDNVDLDILTDQLQRLLEGDFCPQAKQA
ncbi:MAG: TetR family transcriptional regulator [Peptococcaceae bacterium]|nr:TetR family transcriptional regulator [Peptococcaceae bacterium]